MEGLEVSDDVMRRSVVTAGGDMRQAINSLQSGGSDSGSYKDLTLGVAEGLNLFFDARDPAEALKALRQTRLQPIEKVREIQKAVLGANLPPETLRQSLEVLSRADIVMGRIMGSQEWRLLRYLDSTLAQELQPLLMGKGVRAIGTGDLPFPVLLRIWNDSKKIKEISRRYAIASHTGAGSARTQDLPYIFSLCSDAAFREKIEKSLDLDETFDKFLQKEATR